MDPMESLQRSMIDLYVQIMGVDEAYKVLGAEVERRFDSTRRQAFRMEGGFAREAAEILREYPDASFRFVDERGSGFRIEVIIPVSSPTAEKAEEINRRVSEAFDKHVRVNVPGVRLAGSVQRIKTSDQQE